MVKYSVNSNEYNSSEISSKTIKNVGEYGYKGYDFGSFRIKGTTDALLMILDDLKYVIINSGRGCKNYCTISFFVQTTGWQVVYPDKLTLYCLFKDKDHNLIWQVEASCYTKCNYNYGFAIKKEMPIHLYDEVVYANYSLKKVPFVKCN